MITCLSHKGQNSVQRTTFKVLPSHKQVSRLSLKNRLAVELRKPVIVVRKTQQVQFIRSNFFTKKTSSNLILLIHLFCEACSGVKHLRAMKDVNKCPNELKQPLETPPPRKLKYQQNLHSFYVDKMTCDTNIKGNLKTIRN